jgi:hypothetical protein
VTLYFLGRPVEVAGACDDGWVWAPDDRGPGKGTWYWAMQCHVTPWGHT